MDRFPQDAEARELKLQKLIDARIAAVENEIMLRRMSTVRAVAEKTGEQDGDRSLNCDQDEAEALVRAAVIGKSWLVGTRITEVVNYAIYAYVLPLAQADLAEEERYRADESLVARAERWLWNHGRLA